MLDFTHDATARCWLASAHAANTDFAIQNLPFAVFRRAGQAEVWRCGVAIGDQVIDLAALAAANVLTGAAGTAAAAGAAPALNDLMACGPAAWRALRHALFNGLTEGAAAGSLRAAIAATLLPQAQAEYQLPARIGNYSDFFTSIHHARNAGRLFRPGGEDPLTPNFKSLPIAYHGRASSIVISGTPVRRPMGQLMPPGASTPVHAACARLDYELELALWVGVGNAQGQSVALADAQSRLFGIGLLNDWSARDVQAWESQPLGPFLAKNFASSVSPWVVTMDALAPFRCAWGREAGDAAPLAYLDSPAQRQSGGLDIQLEVWLHTPARRSAGGAPVRLSRTTFAHQYWTVAQMLAHHTMGGCNLQPGDLLGSGTVSGPTPAEAGALLELTQGGRAPLQLPLREGETESQAFLADGDAVTMRAWCEAPGAVRIGFGTCEGQVLPALA